jgi:Aldehyde dehydrogenase family
VYGAPKKLLAATAYVYCDYCASLIDFDLRRACEGDTTPGPGYAATVNGALAASQAAVARGCCCTRLRPPVLSVIPADDEQHAITVANDTIYGLNASVFTNDVDRARDVARQLRSGTVGHNAFRTDFGIAFGGFKQSGIGREGGREGLLPFLETKTVILDGRPAGY